MVLILIVISKFDQPESDDLCIDYYYNNYPEEHNFYS
jgi:hypothetical protein